MSCDAAGQWSGTLTGVHNHDVALVKRRAGRQPGSKNTSVGRASGTPIVLKLAGITKKKSAAAIDLCSPTKSSQVQGAAPAPVGVKQKSSAKHARRDESELEGFISMINQSLASKKSGSAAGQRTMRVWKLVCVER